MNTGDPLPSVSPPSWILCSNRFQSSYSAEGQKPREKTVSVNAQPSDFSITVSFLKVRRQK